MTRPTGPLALRAASALAAAVGLLHCSSSSPSDSVACSSVNPDTPATTTDDTCYPDNDGIDNDSYTIDIAVDDTGFFSTGGDDAGTKNIIATQNEPRSPSR